MKRCYHIFLIFFAATFITPVLDLPYYVYNLDVTYLAKVPLVALFLTTVMFHLKYSLRLSFESVIFIGWGVVALVRGLLVNDGIQSALFSHVYAAAMPVFAISFGQYFARDFSAHLLSVLMKSMRVLFYATIGLLLVYLYLYYVAGVWSYYGFGTGMAFVAIYMLSAGRPRHFLLGFVLDVLSGKRAGVIVASLAALIFFRRRLLRMNPPRALASIALLVMGYFGFVYADSFDVFRRFRLIFEFDAEDALAIFYATGGRLTEVVSIVAYMAEEPVRWILGSGMGSRYTFDDPRTGFDPETFHYAHFSPMGYVFLFGAPFALMLYAALFSRVIRGLRYSENFFYLGFLVLFFGSFFGATLFVDPRAWFFLGIIVHLLRNGEGPVEGNMAAQPVPLKTATAA